MKENDATVKKLAASFITVLILTICLCITTGALVWTTVTLDNNIFHTGSVRVNLNDGKPIIEEREFLFEPGMTVKEDFFLENQSTWDVYYRLYLDDIEGGLADVLEITIKDGDKTLFCGRLREMTKSNVGVADDVLKLNERRDLSAYFYFPVEAGNAAQNQRLAFTMKVDAVQAKNNPDKLFD